MCNKNVAQHKNKVPLMKQAILIVILFCSFTTLTSAQIYDPNPPTTIDGASIRQNKKKLDIGKMRFGAYVAPIVTWMQPTSTKDEDGNYKVRSNGSKMGYMWGLMAEYYFAENYGIATGFHLSREGGEIITDLIPSSATPTNTVKYANMKYNLQYLDLPFALKLRSDEFKNKMSIFAQVGLTLKINISKKSSYIINYYDETGTLKSVDGDNEILKGALAINPVLLELNLGAGIEYPITNKLSFYTGIFFNNGFLPDVTNPENYSLQYKGTFKDGTVRLNSFALRVGIFF
jgi:Outer membrane protein beta-barrel domain